MHAVRRPPPEQMSASIVSAGADDLFHGSSFLVPSSRGSYEETALRSRRGRFGSIGCKRRVVGINSLRCAVVIRQIRSIMQRLLTSFSYTQPVDDSLLRRRLSNYRAASDLVIKLELRSSPRLAHPAHTSHLVAAVPRLRLMHIGLQLERRAAAASLMEFSHVSL